jgi:hypothetical protein
MAADALGQLLRGGRPAQTGKRLEQLGAKRQRENVPVSGWRKIHLLPRYGASLPDCSLRVAIRERVDRPSAGGGDRYERQRAAAASQRAHEAVLVDETAPTGSSLAGMAPPRDEVKDLEYPIVVLFGRSVAETLEHCNELFLRYRS